MFDFFKKNKSVIRIDAPVIRTTEDILRLKANNERLKKENAIKKAQLDKERGLFETLISIQNKYKNDKDAASAIEEYEKVISEAPKGLDLGNHVIFLSKLYVKTNQNDRAWGVLNRAIMTGNADLSKIREEQARITKQEKRYVDSLELYLCSYAASYRPEYTFDKFKKNIGVIQSKLGLSDAELHDIYMIPANTNDESVIRDKYYSYMKAKGSC